MSVITTSTQQTNSVQPSSPLPVAPNSPTPTQLVHARANSSPTQSPSSSTSSLPPPTQDTLTPTPPDETAKLIEEVVRLRAALEAEKQKSRELEEKVIAEEKKIEKEAEALFHQRYKKKVQQIKDMLELLKQYKDQLLARPDLAAEFKSLRIGPN